jgi:probable FeS assembly SUF system protein SufT
MTSQNYVLGQDCQATLIPAGDVVTLSKGSEVFVTQTLGGNVTVRADGGLYRIAKEQLGAIKGFSLQRQETVIADDFSEGAVWDALRTCFDPEIPVNIVDLGLIYDLAIETTPSGGHTVEVKMTLTAPGCGMGPVIAEDARHKIAALPTVESAKVHIVWEPIWAPQMISPHGRKVLGIE